MGVVQASGGLRWVCATGFVCDERWAIAPEAVAKRGDGVGGVRTSGIECCGNALRNLPDPRECDVWK